MVPSKVRILQAHQEKVTASTFTGMSQRQRQQAYLKDLKQRFHSRGARKNVIIGTKIAHQDIAIMKYFTSAHPVVLRSIFGLEAPVAVSLRVKFDDTLPPQEKPQHYLVAIIKTA